MGASSLRIGELSTCAFVAQIENASGGRAEVQARPGVHRVPVATLGHGNHDSLMSVIAEHDRRFVGPTGAPSASQAERGQNPCETARMVLATLIAGRLAKAAQFAARWTATTQTGLGGSALRHSLDPPSILPLTSYLSSGAPSDFATGMVGTGPTERRTL